MASIPFVGSTRFDLDQYVNDKALDGLFLMLAEEEKKIRQDPAARVTDLLKEVFGKTVGDGSVVRNKGGKGSEDVSWHGYLCELQRLLKSSVMLRHERRMPMNAAVSTNAHSVTYQPPSLIQK